MKPHGKDEMAEAQAGAECDNCFPELSASWTAIRDVLLLVGGCVESQWLLPCCCQENGSEQNAAMEERVGDYVEWAGDYVSGWVMGT